MCFLCVCYIHVGVTIYMYKYLLVVTCGLPGLAHSNTCAVLVVSVEVTVIGEPEISNTGQNPSACIRVLERMSLGLGLPALC